MKPSVLVIAAIILTLVVLLTPCVVFAQDAKPETPKEVALSEEVDKLKVQLQLALQQNSELRKQLAQTQMQLSQANAQLADVNDQQVQAGGGQLLQQLAQKQGLNPAEYDLTICNGSDSTCKAGEMKFVKKPPQPQTQAQK